MLLFSPFPSYIITCSMTQSQVEYLPGAEGVLCRRRQMTKLISVVVILGFVQVEYYYVYCILKIFIYC